MEFGIQVDWWFYSLVCAAVILRVLLEGEPVGIKDAFTSASAAFLVSFTAVDPALDILPAKDPEKYRGFMIIVFALTGHEILQGIMYAARNPKSLSGFVAWFFRGFWKPPK